ncbi:MAG TPA: sugar transferase [Solirubrobacteraceae bacterium]|nr:sugar transferase [Solirubrobacteraceae bacterium]
MNAVSTTGEATAPVQAPVLELAERSDAQPLVAQRSASFARRALDIFVAGGVLLVLSPVIAAVALIIRLDSGGPVVFRQQRLGRGMRPFTVFKFRTMRHNADATPHREYVESLIGQAEGSERGRLYKLSVDDRVTSVGRYLRSWSLDELPQLVNVLRGDMSLVGPRPVVPYEVDHYPESYLQRFAVKPGLTGLWQVSGRNERTYDEMVRFDIEYAERASLLLDLQILIKTLPVVLGRQGVA